MSSKEKLIQKHGEEGYRKLMASYAKKKWANYDPKTKPHKSGLSYKTPEQRKEIARMGGKARAKYAKERKDRG